MRNKFSSGGPQTNKNTKKNDRVYVKGRQNKLPRRDHAPVSGIPGSATYCNSYSSYNNSFWHDMADFPTIRGPFSISVCWFFVSLEKFSIIWRRHQYRWRTVNLDPSSALMTIPRAHCDTCGHSLLYIIWSVVGLSLPVLTTKSCPTVTQSLTPPDPPPPLPRVTKEYTTFRWILILINPHLIFPLK